MKALSATWPECQVFTLEPRDRFITPNCPNYGIKHKKAGKIMRSDCDPGFLDVFLYFSMFCVICGVPS